MKFLYYLLFAVIFLASCIGDDFSVGDYLVPVKGRNMLLDNLSVELETNLGDSSVTSGLFRLFEGQFNSPDFGIITAHSYFDFTPPEYSLSEFGPDAVATVRFDSISLILKYDNFSYGDTTQTQTINIYKLQQDIELDDYRLYTTSSFPAEPDPWVTHQFNRPNEYWENDTILELRLPDEFGLELMDLMNRKSDLLDTYDNFQTYFKGIKLSPGTNDNAAVNSFALSNEYPVIRFYYSVMGVNSAEDNQIDMHVNTYTAFSQVETDRSNTPLHPISDLNPLSSKETNHKVYLQGLTGLYAKVSFPDLNEILKLGDYVVISSAVLYVYPVLGTYNDFTPLPENLQLNYLDKNGRPLEIYTDPNTTKVQSGILVEDKIFNKNTYYAFDVTSYLQYELGLIGVYKSPLQLSLDERDENNTLKSLVFGDGSFPNKDNRTKLLMSVVIYDNE